MTDRREQERVLLQEEASCIKKCAVLPGAVRAYFNMILVGSIRNDETVRTLSPGYVVLTAFVLLAAGF